MKLEEELRASIEAARRDAEGGPELRMRVIEEALVLLAGELDALREAVEKPPGELTPAERAALYWRVHAILGEMGDGSE